MTYENMTLYISTVNFHPIIGVKWFNINTGHENLSHINKKPQLMTKFAKGTKFYNCNSNLILHTKYNFQWKKT